MKTRRALFPVLRIAVVFPAAQVVGSAFNIWYNLLHVAPLLSEVQAARFQEAITAYNVVAYPLAICFWVWSLLPIARAMRFWRRGEQPAEDVALKARKRIVNLPWWALLAAAPAWLGCIPTFLYALSRIEGVPAQAGLHLVVSLAIGGLIAVTLGVFLVELLCVRLIYPVAFSNFSAWQVPGTLRLGLVGRGMMGAAAAAVAPVICMLLVSLTPRGDAAFPLAVAIFATSFALLTAWLFSLHVLGPIQALQKMTRRILEGDYAARVVLPRADELGRLIDGFNRMAAGLEEKEKLRSLFGKHVGRKAAARLLEDLADFRGEEQTAAIVFADLREFTRHAERLSPADVVEQLNEFFAAMTFVIEDRYNGFVDKFLGDGLLAVFGLGEAMPSGSIAISAAQEMQEALCQLNAVRCIRGLPEWKMGIGIHVGTVLAGCVGSPQRLEFTVMGDAVNLASRVQDLTKNLNECVLLTHAAAIDACQAERLRSVGRYILRGREEETEIYALESH